MMEPSFEKLLVLLAESQIRFLVVGGIAVMLHGYVRLTEDVDLLIADDDSNLATFLSVLSNYGEGYASELSPSDFTPEEGAIRIVEEAEQIQIDVFTRMSGRRYQDVVSDAESFRIGCRTVRYASKQALIEWKSGSVREKDRLDASALRKLQENPRAFD